MMAGSGGRVPMEFERLSSKYFGATASGYEAHRLDDKWMAEQRAAEDLLKNLPKGSKVLDAPVGTGRLIPLLANREWEVYGLDVSADMLAEAKAQAQRCGQAIELRQGDIRRIPFPDGSFDLVTCLRFLNWVDSDGVSAVVKELSRVSNSRLLIGVRYLIPSDELKYTAADLLRRIALLFRLPSLRARRWGIVLHRKDFIEGVFSKAGLTIKETRFIERRWDVTDYSFYWLEKAVHA